MLININIKMNTEKPTKKTIINYKSRYKNLFKKLNEDYILMFEKIIYSFNLDNDYSKFIFLEYFFIKNKLNNNFRFNLDIYSDMININMEDIINVIPSDFYKIIITNLNPIVPFWNSKIKNISDTLFLPSFENIEKLSTPKTFNCNKNFITEHYKSKTLQKNIEYNKTRNFINKNSNNNIRARKIKMFLNKDQRCCMNKIFGIYRYFYNRAIQFINNYCKDLNSASILIDNSDIFSRVSFKFNDNNIFSMNNMRKYLKKKIIRYVQ